jgi:hypothetical protein
MVLLSLTTNIWLVMQSVISRTQESILLSWQVEDNGGAEIGEYRLEVDGGHDALDV